MKGLTTPQRKRLLLERLYKRQNALCHWCQVWCYLAPRGKHYREGNPSNLATTDHLDDKFDPMRGKRPGELRKVMACNACNGRRSAERMAEHIEEQRRRSGRFPSVST